MHRLFYPRKILPCFCIVPSGKLYLLHRLLFILPRKILLPSSTVSYKKYTYSIIHHLFQWEKILTSFIATSETKYFIICHPFSHQKNYYLLYGIFGKSLLCRPSSFSTRDTLSSLQTLELECSATGILSSFFIGLRSPGDFNP
jgi:hypothetical protein